MNVTMTQGGLLREALQEAQLVDDAGRACGFEVNLERSLLRNLAHLVSMADGGAIHLQPDFGGDFFWTLERDGREVMHGGLNYHGPKTRETWLEAFKGEELPYYGWSINT